MSPVICSLYKELKVNRHDPHAQSSASEPTLVPNETCMREAIRLATASGESGDYALGAVIALDGRIIATGTTNLKHEYDPTVHAEIVAIRNACRLLRQSYLPGCVLYSTHEPCPMCSGAAIWAKMTGVVFGATMEDARHASGAQFSWRQIDIRCRDVLSAGSPRLLLVEEFMRDECTKLFRLSRKPPL